MSRVEDPAQAILDAAQLHDSPSAAIQSRTWAAVERRWAAGDQGPALDADPSATVTAATTGGSVAKGWIVLGLVAVVGVVGAIGALGDREPSSREAVVAVEAGPPVAEAPTDEPVVEAPSVVTPSASAESSAPEASEARVTPSDDREPVRTHTPPPRRSTPAATRTKTPPPSDEPSTEPAEPEAGTGLSGEVALLASARRALSEGQPKKALELLDRHRREFPSGRLAQERELSRITALCETGADERAHRAAVAFLERHPSEALRRRLAGTCADVDRP